MKNLIPGHGYFMFNDEENRVIMMTESSFMDKVKFILHGQVQKYQPKPEESVKMDESKDKEDDESLPEPESETVKPKTSDSLNFILIKALPNESAELALAN